MNFIPPNFPQRVSLKVLRTVQHAELQYGLRSGQLEKQGMGNENCANLQGQRRLETLGYHHH